MIISRIALKQNVSYNNVNGMIWGEKWYQSEFTNGNEKEPWSNTWLTDDEQTSIQYIQENLINLSYIVIKGKDREEISAHICNSLDVISREEVRKILQNESYFAENSEKYLDAVYSLGVIAIPRNYDDELFALFKKVLSHYDAEVRNAGIIALHFIGWKEFKEPLEQIQKTDSNSAIRKFAGLALDALSKKNWKDMARPSRLYFVEPKQRLGLYSLLNRKIQRIKILEEQNIEDSDLMEAVKNVVRGEPIPEQLKEHEAEIAEIAKIIGQLPLSRGKTFVVYSGMLASLIGKGKMTFKEAFDNSEKIARLSGGAYPPSQQGAIRAIPNISQTFGLNSSEELNSRESVKVLGTQYWRQNQFNRRYLEMLLEQEGINLEDSTAVKEFQEKKYEKFLRKSVKQFYGIDYFTK